MRTAALSGAASISGAAPGGRIFPLVPGLLAVSAMNRQRPPSSDVASPRGRRPAGVADPRTAPTEPAFTAPVASGAAPALPEDYAPSRLVHVGRGSEVWRATDAAGLKVAVKVGRRGDAATAARFAAEARALASLTHRSIVRLQGHGETGDGRPFLALEWLEGEAASQLLEDRDAGIPPRDAIRLLLPIASALALAHDRGFVHGDVRAENVIVVSRGDGLAVPKLIDFASAKRILPSTPPPSVNEPTRRVSAVPDAGDPAVDIRGFAATIFHAIAGRSPFSAPPAGRGSPVPRTGLSERDAVLWRILAEGLAPGSAGRFRSVHDFVRELAGWAGLRGVDADITGSPISTRLR